MGRRRKKPCRFQIVEISHIWDDAFGGGGEADVQPPIAAAGGALGQAESIGRVADLDGFDPGQRVTGLGRSEPDETCDEKSGLREGYP